MDNAENDEGYEPCEKQELRPEDFLFGATGEVERRWANDWLWLESTWVHGLDFFG